MCHGLVLKKEAGRAEMLRQRKERDRGKEGRMMSRRKIGILR